MSVSVPRSNYLLAPIFMASRVAGEASLLQPTYICAIDEVAVVVGKFFFCVVTSTAHHSTLYFSRALLLQLVFSFRSARSYACVVVICILSHHLSVNA